MPRKSRPPARTPDWETSAVKTTAIISMSSKARRGRRMSEYQARRQILSDLI
ncbi:hypothetical protein HMPREF1862_01973 [Varibaculum cambriense]|uniref:Uncharacterized protein n=1 Tax=Varibaculum cambriense TaxID=184870 RepID=A0AB34WXK8_9ACTO|nr:hypothetical protein HMPREF1862_01973 [Varibaculum cambriense]